MYTTDFFKSRLNNSFHYLKTFTKIKSGVTHLFFDLNQLEVKKSAILKRCGYHSNGSDVIFLKKLHSFYSDFCNSVLFAVPRRANYSKNAHEVNHTTLVKSCGEPPFSFLYFFFVQVKNERIKVLTVTVVRATGVKVGGFQFLDCMLNVVF